MNIKFFLLSGVFFVITIISFSQPESSIQLSSFSAKEFSLINIGLEEYPFKKTITQILESPPPDNWERSTIDKQEYLEMMERIVRVAAKWVNDDGAVIDPYYKAEFGQTTPRFVSSASVLLHFGRITDLKPLVIRAMSYCCSKLRNRKADSPDFWMRELATGFICLKPLVQTEHWHSWENLLKQVDPEKTYRETEQSGKKLDELHNWAVYSSGGEYLREAFGLTSSLNKFLDGKNFFEKYMQPQLVHFTQEGMYRDPNDPITYDITTRLQIANALAFGYDGRLKGQLSELLRRGGLTMLLFTSPDGYTPYGGRSGQFQFQEAIIAALSELEASRYKENDGRLAGAFKRQAHISAHSMRRWIIEMQPLRHIKNGFNPETEHGIDEYGKYSVYTLYCSSVLGLAALYADDDIREYPCPSEIGGYLIELFPAFHKVFASVKDTQIEIDTKSDKNYEATGLGRFQAKNVPLELGLSMPFTVNPKYRLSDSLKPHDCYAIGPSWRSNNSIFSLADLSVELAHNLISGKVNKDTIEFDIEYQNKAPNDVTIHQHYKLFNRNLCITSSVNNAYASIDSIRFIVPLLVSNGLSESYILQDPGQVTVNYLGHSYKIEFNKKIPYNISSDCFANRNGIYKNLIIQSSENKMIVNLKLE